MVATTYRATAIVCAVLSLATVVGGRTVNAQTPPSSAGPADPVLIEGLVAAYRILADQGVLDILGHVSVRHPRNPDRYLISRQMPPADDIIEFDLDSAPVDQRGRAMWGERFIHGEIYKVRADVNAVIHTHSPGVVPFSITQSKLQPVHQQQRSD